MPFNEVARNGFSYAFGRFYTVPDRVERVAGSSLRDAFLPKLTAQAKQFIGYGGDRFVRGQLKHYGVMFDESELSGNGTLLFKKLLQAGKCDEVPPHITKLRVEMHEEWLAQVTPEELSSHPNWTMEKYFLTSGEPDCAKTTTVIGIPLDAHSRYRSSQICEAASKIAGLHQKTGHGPKTQTIILGWDLTAVSQAAGGHAAKEREAAKAAEEEREKERAESHADYLKTLNREKGRQTHSPIGTYIVDCEEIERGWSDQAGDLSLDIRGTDEPGVFEASFDFGVLEGIMIMSTDKEKLEEYYSRLESDEYDNEDEGDEYDGYDDEYEVETSSKRKATVPTPGTRGRPRKKPEASTSKSQKLYLKLRCTETGEGQIFYMPEDGTITFQGENMAKFSGTAGFPCVGQAVSFTGRKTADEVVGSGKS